MNRSNPSKKKSGYENRKRKKEMEEKVKKLPKLDVFCIQMGNKSTAVENEKPDKFSEEISDSNVANVPEPEVDTRQEQKLHDDLMRRELREEVSGDQNREKASELEFSTIITSEPELRDSDRALHSCELSDGMKKIILSLKPSRPKGPFPQNDNNRSFSENYYYVLTKTNKKIERFWLCYSKTNDAVYCEPCWLFADRHDPNFKSSWCDAKINDWQGLSAKISIHEKSKIHINACVTYSQWKNEHDIESNMVGLLARWQEILKRIVDVIVTLARCNLPLRGHREKYTAIESQSGNFLNIIDLLSRYDPLLRSHLENKDSKTKYLSPLIQNELISIAATNVTNQIVNEIAETDFFSIILQ